MWTYKRVGNVSWKQKSNTGVPERLGMKKIENERKKEITIKGMLGE